MSGQAARFAVLSGVSFIGYLGLTAFLHEVVGATSYAAVPIAMGCVTLFNFCTLRIWIFAPTERGWFKELTGFLASIAGFRAAEYAAFVLAHGLLGMPYLIAYATILALSAVGKFLFLRNILFAPARGATTLPEAAP